MLLDPQEHVVVVSCAGRSEVITAKVRRDATALRVPRSSGRDGHCGLAKESERVGVGVGDALIEWDRARARWTGVENEELYRKASTVINK